MLNMCGIHRERIYRNEFPTIIKELKVEKIKEKKIAKGSIYLTCLSLSRDLDGLYSVVSFPPRQL